MNGAEKIRPEHKERCAFVYARQSTAAQVLRHHTSTERQCELTQLAAELGWAHTQIELIAEDLGRSGKFSEDRDGFQRLAAEVSLGHVGAIFSLDAASRLARSSADWHRLLEIAGLTRTLLIDENTVYDPREPNDRLVLGMKGTMADFELVWLRQRMEGGRWHLARKGEYRVHQPVGYVYDDNRLVMDPDEEVRRAVALVFERYRVAGSLSDVVRHFADHGLRFPARFGQRVTWTPLRHPRVADILQNPFYAGTYTFGRLRSETILDQGRRRRRVRKLPMSEWPVVRHGAHPGYITWEEFVANQKRLQDSAPQRSGVAGRGAPREGRALLQGLLLCGRCTNRLTVSYRGQDGRYPAYECTRLQQAALGERCVRVSSRYVDGPVVELVLRTLTRQHLGAAIQVVELVEQEDAALEQQWKLRLERARYESKRAERQYDACDPDNRVVARTLETRWNEKLLDLERLQREHEEWRRRQHIELTEIERRRILELAEDLPRLWRAKTTTDRDRKMLLRLLIHEVSLREIDVPRNALRLQVLWHTGAVTELEVDRPGGGDVRRPLTWRLVSTTTPKTVEAMP
jgi:DNA invertase Pin-like site-specific DNA recombinase